MVNGIHPPERDRIAIASSIAVHLCVLALLATLPRASFPVDEPDERVLLSSIVQIEHRPPPRATTPRRIAAENAVAILPRPVIHAAVTVEHAARKLVVAAEYRASTTTTRVATRQQPHRAEANLFTAAAVQVTAPPGVASTASPAPAASPAPSPVIAQREEGIGNFGETYPAAVDPAARSTLIGGVGSGLYVKITVDENGRATSIEFVRGPADPALREELRSRLLAARFIPAACNGLRCAGTFELKT